MCGLFDLLYFVCVCVCDVNDKHLLDKTFSDLLAGFFFNIPSTFT